MQTKLVPFSTKVCGATHCTQKMSTEVKFHRMTRLHTRI